MPTASMLPLLVVIAALWGCTGGQVLPIVLFTSVFGAASVINLGVIGVPPWLFSFVLCIVLRLVFKGHDRMALAPGYNKSAVCLFLLFVLWTVLSAVCFPLIFQGVFVDHGSWSGPLTWRVSNLAQVLYLLAVSAVYLLTIGASPEERANAQEWFVRGCIVASLFAFYQLANATIHIPYPSAALYTSPSYVIYPAYRINGFWRLNSTFCEASEMASFLLPGAALLGWELLTSRVRLWRAAAFLLIVCALLFTMSSLAYLGLIAMFMLGSVLYAVRVLRQRSISHVRVIVLLLLVSGLGTFGALSEKGATMVSQVLSATILDKDKSDSYRERTATHVSALRTLEETAYMGAGWGSIRASGLGYMLLGTVGVPGLLLFMTFYLANYLPFFYRRARPSEADRNQFVPAHLAVGLVLLSMFTAGSEPVTPMLWMLLGVIATARPLPRPGGGSKPARAFYLPFTSPSAIRRAAL
jgi:O-antigen ligase